MNQNNCKKSLMNSSQSAIIIHQDNQSKKNKNQNLTKENDHDH